MLINTTGGIKPELGSGRTGWLRAQALQPSWWKPLATEVLGAGPGVLVELAPDA